MGFCAGKCRSFFIFWSFVGIEIEALRELGYIDSHTEVFGYWVIRVSRSMLLLKFYLLLYCRLLKEELYEKSSNIFITGCRLWIMEFINSGK